MWKTIIRSAVFGVIVAELIVIFAFWRMGFAITYSPNIEYDWVAIGASGQWASAIAGLLIPIAAVYFAYKLQANERSIGESNRLLLDELKEAKTKSETEIDMLKQTLREVKNELEKFEPISNAEIDNIFNQVFRQNTVPVEKSDKEMRDELKENILKFVNISMFVKTSQVAKHLDIEDKVAWEILRELCRHDRKIDSGGPIQENDFNRNVWLKKKSK